MSIVLRSFPFTNTLRIGVVLRKEAEVQEAFGKFPQGIPKIGLHDVVVIDGSHPLIPLMRSAIRTEEDITGIRFSKNAINGQVIEDAYAYRVK